MGRGEPAAAPARAAHARARPAGLLPHGPAARAEALHAARDGRTTSWPCWTPPGWRARTSSGTTGAAWSPGRWAPGIPTGVRTLTALSVPHPAAMAKAMVTSDQALRSYYMGVFQLPFLPERLLLAQGGKALRGMLRGGGLSREAAAHYVARMQEPGALSAALGWYRAMPVRGARPGGHRPGAHAARVEHRRRLPRPGRHRGDGAVRRRPVPAGDPGRRHATGSRSSPPTASPS